MTFRLATLLYLFALLAASLAVFGVWGIVVAGLCFAAGWARAERGSWREVPEVFWATLIIIVTIAMLVPAVQNAQPHTSTLKSISSNNVKQLMLALLNYESVHGHFPPASITDDRGNALYSWRVELLPYLEQDNIYRQLQLDEPWDSPHNRPLLDQANPYLFSSPRVTSGPYGSDRAHYLAIVDEASAWPPGSRVGFKDIPRGEVNTVMLLEVGGLDIHWVEPRDLSMDEAIDALVGTPTQHFEAVQPGQFVTHQSMLNGRIVGFIDGQVSMLPKMPDRETAREYLTRVIEPDGKEFDQHTSVPNMRVVKTIVHWDRIWGVAVWLGLVLLPLVPAAWKRIWPTREDLRSEEQEATEKAERV